MKKAALIEIHTGDVSGLLETLRDKSAGPPSGDISLSECSFSKESCVLEHASALPESLDLPAYGTICLNLPVTLFDFRVITLPFSSRETLSKVIPFELEPLIIEEISGIVYDFIEIGTSDGNNTVLVAFIRKSILKEILDSLAPRGIDPEIVTCLDLLAAAGGSIPEVVSSLSGRSAADPAARREAAVRELRRPSLNFRKGDFMYTKKSEGMSKRLKVTALLSVILALLLNTSLALQSFLLSREAAGVSQQTRALYASLFPQDRRITDETYQLKSHLKDLQARGDVIISADPLPFLLGLSAGKPRDVIYHEITINRGTVTLKGDAPAAGDVEKVKASLSGILEGISAADVKPLPDGKVSFVVSGRRQQ